MRINTELTPQEVEQFDRDGYVILGKVPTEEMLLALQQRIDDILLMKIQYEGLAWQVYGKKGLRDSSGREATLRYRKLGNLHKDDLFLFYFQMPLFRNITRCYIGQDVALQRNMFFNNFPHEGGIGFHQDGGEGWSWAYDPHPVITIWTALDRATAANGCVHVVPSTHKELVPVAGIPEIVERSRIVPLEVEAGEAILLHNWTFHGSYQNESDSPRRAVTVCYCDSQTRYNGQPANLPRVFGEGAMIAGVTNRSDGRLTPETATPMNR